ncbi:MAG: SDH family Clp fold serine proteinase [Alphaproteobacteria bacterium]
MANSTQNKPDKTDDPLAEFRRTRLFASIVAELNSNQDQLVKRKALIQKIENALSSRYKAKNRMVSYIVRFGHPKAMIHTSDIAAIDSVLTSVVHADEINVLLHGPGGDGSIVEKMIEMCRDHLPMRGGKLRVIVPNIAKSAASLFALGADKIIMGYCSDLGPIDPQVPVTNAGITHYISAFSFVESRDSLMKQLAEAIKNKEPTAGFLTQLAGLNIPFTQEMENSIHFAENTATRMLEKYMLKARIKDPKKREAKAKEIAEKLLSKKLFPIHGHFISAETAKNDLELDVDILERTDELWKMIWEYYIRAEIQMMIPPAPGQEKIKLYESSEDSLISQEPVR